MSGHGSIDNRRPNGSPPRTSPFRGAQFGGEHVRGSLRTPTGWSIQSGPPRPDISRIT